LISIFEELVCHIGVEEFFINFVKRTQKTLEVVGKGGVARMLKESLASCETRVHPYKMIEKQQVL